MFSEKIILQVLAEQKEEIRNFRTKRLVTRKEELAQSPSLQNELRRMQSGEPYDAHTPDIYVEPPFYCDYGNLIHAEEKVFINFGCIIGAGSVVVKDIPDDSLAVGNPARVIKKLN